MTKLFTSISECQRSPQDKCTFHKKTRINRIILLLIGIELFFIFVFSLTGPFVSVFIREGISGATMSVVGIASMIFLITKSTLQIPFSRVVDRTIEENSIVGILAGGYAITALCPLILAFSASAWQVYLAQFFCGLGNALAYPSWNALFTHHIDKNRRRLNGASMIPSLVLVRRLPPPREDFLLTCMVFKKYFSGLEQLYC